MANCEICGAPLSWGRASHEDISKARNTGIVLPDDICYNCFHKAREAGGNENERKLTEVLSQIRITTYPPDLGAKYEHCGLVTARAAIGTGPITELISSWTDFFGLESGTYNEKLRKGEQSCMMKLQQQAILHNANAIVGTHITYTELTRGHGMVLVCMTGTAIRLENGPQDIQDRYNELFETWKRLTGG